MRSLFLLAALSATVIASGVLAVAQEQASSPDTALPIHGQPPSSGSSGTHAGSDAPRNTSPKAAPGGVTHDAALRIEGEKRFRANCGRCHMAPHKFPPRAMGTIVRHMRVRAMITDEDMRLILRYMTQ